VRILVSDDASTDETPQVLERLAAEYPCLSHYRRETRGGYDGNFRDLFTRQKLTDTEWTWMFGDDDMLRPGAISFMLKHLETTPAQFIHVAEMKRTSGTNHLIHGSMLDLCNTFGWIEMTGFITCNVVRSQQLVKAFDTPRWRTYAKSAFAQSCVLLEQLRDEPCAFMDIPLVESQDAEQTAETGERWKADHIGERYLLIADALEVMYEDGILTKKVKPAFFRYLIYGMWDRFLTSFIVDYLDHQYLWTDAAWHRTIKMASFVTPAEEADRIIRDIEAARGLSTLHNYLAKELNGIADELRRIFERHNTAIYPYTYMLSADMEAKEKEDAA
jgi:glycosyltransferase involved in cell wall biosynthesis